MFSDVGNYVTCKMRCWYLSHCRATNAEYKCKWIDSPEPSPLAHIQSDVNQVLESILAIYPAGNDSMGVKRGLLRICDRY